ncbi:MAG: hypothetical protein EGQ74_22850 [Bacteroides nordii]|uniref:Uncharacterized protein n=1 Tax=Bacteroides nordii TaxID=291645 RepID=A0A413V9W7_9BACE|nr:hypothetical protein [Bacteroides nordii]RHB30391.1 hypothetical protein DW888_18870 [Bacteroides nordii]
MISSFAIVLARLCQPIGNTLPSHWQDSANVMARSTLYDPVLPLITLYIIIKYDRLGHPIFF